jgi:hypothetical protein
LVTLNRRAEVATPTCCGYNRPAVRSALLRTPVAIDAIAAVLAGCNIAIFWSKRMILVRLSLVSTFAIWISVSCSRPLMAQLAADTSATAFAVFATEDVTLESYSTVLGDVYAGADILVDFALGIQRESRHSGNYFAFRDIKTTGGL